MLDSRILAKPRVHFQRQLEDSECGLACLVMVASYYGRLFDLREARQLSQIGDRGMTLKALIAMAARLNMGARAVRVEPATLKLLRVPAIAHWDLNHFVVIERLTSKGAVIHDPAKGTFHLNMAEISRHLTGVALEVSPNSDFCFVDTRARLKLRHLWANAHGIKSSFIITIALSLCFQVLTLVSPYYLRLALDIALPRLDLGFMMIIAIGFAIVAILSSITYLLRQSVLLASGATLGYILSSNVASHLFRLPITWFKKRGAGDVLSRFHSIVPLRKALAEDAPSAIIDGGMAVLTFVLMSIYSGYLSLLSGFALLCIAMIRLALVRQQALAQENSISAFAVEQAVMIENVQNIQSLRLAVKEQNRQQVWQQKMTAQVNNEVHIQRLSNLASAAQNGIFALENIISIWIGIILIVKGYITIGVLFAFLAYKLQFLNAGTSLISKLSDLRTLRIHLDRLGDIVLEEKDVRFKSLAEEQRNFQGKIELRGVSFSYPGSDNCLLNNVSVIINPGDYVAITGPSGGGKSTLLMLVLGIIKPTVGRVLIDDMEISSFGYEAFYRQTSAVLQDDRLFAGSIHENISMFEDDPDFERVEFAAKSAAIHAEIIAMPMGYRTVIGEMGSSLSGGQRQRILLARALYRRPRLVVMDESTSHLDVANEAAVNSSISNLGATRLIVAHRKETISAAHRQYSLISGVLKELKI